MPRILPCGTPLQVGYERNRNHGNSTLLTKVISMEETTHNMRWLHRFWTAFTWEGIFVSIQSGKLFAIVAAEGIPSVALVGAQPQAISLALRLQVEAAVLSVNLLVHPVLHLHEQLVVSLPP